MNTIPETGVVQEMRLRFSLAAQKMPQVAMSSFETNTFFNLMKMSDAEAQAAWDSFKKDVPYEYSVLEKVCARFRRETAPAVRLFLCTIVLSPGDVVLYLSYAHWQAKERGWTELGMDELIDVFPMGFWSGESRSRLWEAQKRHDSPRGNGLDDAAVLAWINAEKGAE